MAVKVEGMWMRVFEQGEDADGMFYVVEWPDNSRRKVYEEDVEAGP